MPLDLVELCEPQTGSYAAISVSQGFNCYAFRTERDGELIDVLWAHPEFAHGGQRPSGSGIPLLFPFAGRIRGTSFEYQGRRYPLEEGDGRGNAIHGFVMRRAWRVLEQSKQRVVGQFHAALDDPSLLDCWPSDFRITVSYELRQGALVSQVEIDNPSDQPLPFGFATHAYFRVPPVPSGGTNWMVQVPVQNQWELAELLPTGRKIPNSDQMPLVRGMPFEACQFDNVFTDLEFSDGHCTTRLFEPTRGRAVTQRFDDSFRHCVVYTPPHREAICMEPYTSLPDPFHMAEAGVESGFRVLPVGEKYQTEIVVNVE